MNPSVLFVFILSILLGVLRAADLAFGTDAVTGLCVVGSVWWRYLVLGIVVLAAAGAQITLGAASGLGGFVRCILECLCSAWLSTMGRCWLSPNEWKKPFGGLYLAVAGSLLFYWNVLLRFMENSSSWHRVTPTAAVWQALAALVFLAALARALHVPQPGNDKTLCAAGLAAFALCLCWQLPYVLVLMSGLSWAAPAVWPEIFAGLGLCCVGGIGGACVAACLNGES